MEHADTAQLAAVAGAVGSILVMLARGRLALLAGLTALGGAAVALALSLDSTGLDKLSSAAGMVAAAGALAALACGAALLVRRPRLVPLAVLVAAPLRPPISFDPSSSLLVTIADDGRLGRLLPLYAVLAAAALALGWRALRGERPAALPRAIALPGAAFLAFAMVSLTWADDVEAGTNLVLFFTLPFAVLLATVSRSPFPDGLMRPLAATAIALASLFAAVGLWQAVTHQLFFFAPNLAVSNANTDFFRVTSLFGDPSLYGRHVVLGIGVALALLAARRSNRWLLLGALVVMWAGLLFSYSQSSMAALLVITLGIAFASGDRGVRRGVALVGIAAVLATAAYAGIQVAGGESLNQITSDRTDRVESTVRVVREEPLIGVGIGGQPSASRRLAGSERPTANFVSHTTPLAVAAELGLAGLALYAWLLVGGVRLIMGCWRRDQALGLALGAALGALFVHALFYSGFIEDPLTWLVLAVAAGYLAAHPLTPAERAAERRAARERPAAVAR